MPLSGLVWQLMSEDSEDGPSWESSTPITTAVASVDSTMHSATIAKPGARFAFARKFHVSFLKRPGKAGRKNPESGPLLPPQAACVAGRKTLVLDLDETLVHSNFEGNAPSFTVQVNIADAVHNIHVAKRPRELLSLQLHRYRLLPRILRRALRGGNIYGVNGEVR